MKIRVISLLLALIAAPITAQADVYCPAQISIFGTVDAVSGNVMTVDTTSNIGHIHVLMHRPAMDRHGLALRPGVFAGVYGCLQRGGRTFDADAVTLASSARAYADFQRPYREYDGRIVRTSGGRIQIQTGGGTLWITISQRGLSRGQRVRVRGYYDPSTGTFVGSRVDVNR